MARFIVRIETEENWDSDSIERLESLLSDVSPINNDFEIREEIGEEVQLIGAFSIDDMNVIEKSIRNWSEVKRISVNTCD